MEPYVVSADTHTHHTHTCTPHTQVHTPHTHVHTPHTHTHAVTALDTLSEIPRSFRNVLSVLSKAATHQHVLLGCETEAAAGGHTAFFPRLISHHSLISRCVIAKPFS